MTTSVLQSRRAWLGGGAVAALLIMAAGWLLLIQPELSSAASLRSQAQSAQFEDSLLLAKTAQLRKQSQNLGTMRTSLADALAALPSDSGLPAFTNQLTAQAAANQVTLTSIVVGAVTAPTTASGAPATSTTGAVYQIPVTIISTGTLANQEAFLKAIEVTGPRRALLTSTQLTVAAGARVASIDNGASVTTQLTVFSAPRSPQESAALQKLLNGTATP